MALILKIEETYTLNISMYVISCQEIDLDSSIFNYF